MKKTVLLLLVLALLLGASACRGKAAPDAGVSPPGSGSPGVRETLATDEVIVVNNLTLTDNGFCSLLAKSIDPDGENGYTLSVQITNKTDSPLYFCIRDASLNTLMCDPYWSVTLDGGAFLDTEIVWYANDLAFNGIGTVRMIEFTLEARADEASDAVFRETLQIFPYGDNAEALVFDPRPTADGDRVFVDNDEYLFIITQFDAETAFRYAVNVYIENRTEANLFFTIDKVLVNSLPCDPFWAAGLPAGRRANSAVSWLDFNPHNITDVKELAFTIKIYNADDWAAPPVYMQDVTVRP